MIGALSRRSMMAGIALSAPLLALTPLGVASVAREDADFWAAHAEWDRVNTAWLTDRKLTDVRWQGHLERVGRAYIIMLQLPGFALRIPD